jgi:leucyl aminopeptidase
MVGPVAVKCKHGFRLSWWRDVWQTAAMFDRAIECLADPSVDALPVYALRPADLAAFLDTSPHGAFLRAGQFAADRADLRLLPGGDGVSGAVLGLGVSRDPYVFGALPFGLPPGDWRIDPSSLASGSFTPEDAVLGFCLGAYQFTEFKPPRPSARLAATPGMAASLARAIWLVRDLINMPADRLGPAELAEAALEVGARFGADCSEVTGDALDRDYPAIAAVGAGSNRPPVVAILRWRGSQAGADAPLLSLCGKGVCFDTGGYDLKPSAGMLRMKKDMGGAAVMLGLARAIMAADLPIRLVLRLGCVENSVSGHAMRPSDVLATRRGLAVEVGNTDAEGRLVLCDLLSEASDERPDLLMDAATLTGAARVALGPEIVAMFCNDDAVATILQDAGAACHDPVWRLPLWTGYDSWLSSRVADMNNVGSKPAAGAVVAALFLQRFVATAVRWVHLDTYAWNDQTTAGRPEGGEAQALRAAFAATLTIFNLGFRNEPT